MGQRMGRRSELRDCVSNVHIPPFHAQHADYQRSQAAFWLPGAHPAGAHAQRGHAQALSAHGADDQLSSALSVMGRAGRHVPAAAVSQQRRGELSAPAFLRPSGAHLFPGRQQLFPRNAGGDGHLEKRGLGFHHLSGDDCRHRSRAVRGCLLRRRDALSVHLLYHAAPACAHDRRHADSERRLHHGRGL